MTTNCIQKPQESYKDNIFTTGPGGLARHHPYPGPQFRPVIDKALEMPGFAEDSNGKP
jgi:hydroxylamine reductase